MMLVDSHCHINFPELSDRLPQLLDDMRHHDVSYALAISVSRETFDEVENLANTYPNIFCSVGIHPAEKDAAEFTVAELLERTSHKRVVAIGETGLDYHWCEGDLSWQYQRFITHIEASRQSGLPLIIHTRKAGLDTLKFLREHNANCGVIHCFSEDVAFARAALDLGFYISFSGIVTFKNAKSVQEACCYVPNDRLLVETDAPYLAPVPFRGQLNQPAYVKYTAQHVATLRGQSFEEIAQITTNNFFRLFNKAQR
ncbi:MAG: TatD family hydrolase [Neisseriaceae bacterium]|nr:TatD family hydrolase [Neisseriaceae bacterium]